MANKEPNTISSIHEHVHDDHEQLLYDVFLSFRGSDTQLGFTGNLFNALRSKRFKTFMDNDGLNSGNQVIASIFKAVERSKIPIVVFSKCYASSSYCLNELVKIVECREMKNQLVFPIFYDIDPSEVRNQTGSYGKSIVSHEYRFGKESDRLQKWKSALFEVANIPGLHFKKWYIILLLSILRRLFLLCTCDIGLALIHKLIFGIESIHLIRGGHGSVNLKNRTEPKFGNGSENRTEPFQVWS